MQPSQSAKHKPKRFWLIITAAIALIFIIMSVWFGFYAASSRDYESKVNHMKTGLEDATKNLLGPMGGLERQSARVTHGEKLPVFPCIDVSCPTVESHWYLLADQEEDKALEGKIKTAILEKSSPYKWSVSLIVGILGKSEQPSPPPVGKEWFNISIAVTDAPK